MLIVEGGMEKGSIWGIFEPLGGFTAGNNESDAFIGVKRPLNPCLPFGFYAPPAKGDSIYYECDKTPYGDRFDGIEVGWLKSTKGPSSENPCYHSTVNGTIIQTDRMGDPVTYLSRGGYEPLSGYYISPSTPASVYAGYPSTFSSSAYKAFGRKGDRISEGYPAWPLSLKTTKGTYLSGWETTSYTSNSTNLAAGRPTIGEPYFTSAKPFIGFLQSDQFKVHRQSWAHTGRNTWVEDYWGECHSSSSYYAYDMLPPNDGKYSQLGFTIAYAHYSFVHRMRYIKTVVDGDFRAFIETTCNVTYGGWKNRFPRARFYEGTYQYSSSGWFQIFSLEPGKVAASNCDTTMTDYFCSLASDYSRSLYQCSAAKSARTSAVNDVKGLDSNWIENLSQVGGTFEVINPLITGYAAFLGGDLSLAKKALAEGYLAYKYAVAPGISDYIDIRDNYHTTLGEIDLGNLLQEKRHGAFYKNDVIRGTSSVQQQYRCTYTLSVKDNPLAKVWSALERLGLEPTSQRFWDLITLSFVADWFLSIGPTLQTLSAYQNLVMSKDMQSRTESYKVQWDLLDADEEKYAMPPGFKRVGRPLQFVHYNRQISYGKWGSIDLSITPDSNGLSRSQWTQGLSLLTLYKG